MYHNVRFAKKQLKALASSYYEDSCSIRSGTKVSCTTRMQT